MEKKKKKNCLAWSGSSPLYSHYNKSNNGISQAINDWKIWKMLDNFFALWNEGDTTAKEKKNYNKEQSKALQRQWRLLPKKAE